MIRARTSLQAATIALAVIASTGSLLAQGDSTRARRAPRIDPSDTAIVVPGRSVVATKFGIVATSQPLASAAGVQILAQGGNAVDAIIAANATLGLMEPMMNGIGGDLFAIVYEAKTGKLYGLNSGGWAATGETVDLLASKNITRMPQRGVWSVTVPGAVAGWDALRTKFGTFGFDKILAPAIYYAENGFPVSQIISENWQPAATNPAGNAAFKTTYLIDGKAPQPGQLFSNPDLGASLRRIAEKGKDGFYTGPTADAILSTLKELGGTMTAADLKEFTPEWVTPLHTTYSGWTVYELPPNGQGIAALEMLNIMSRFPDQGGRVPQHQGDARRDRGQKARLLGSAQVHRRSALSKLPVEQILGSANADARAKLIDERRATCRVEPAQFAGLESKGSETIYMTAVDKDGNIVSLIQSNYSEFGSGLVPAHPRLRAPQSRRAVHPRSQRAEYDRAAQASAAHDHPGVHAKGRYAHQLRHHGRVEPVAGARAVRVEHRRLRHGHSTGARGRTFHQGDLQRMRCADRVEGPRRHHRRTESDGA